MHRPKFDLIGCTVYTLHCSVGWSDFEEHATLSILCQIVIGPQFQHFMS